MDMQPVFNEYKAVTIGVNISRKQEISVHKPGNKQPKNPLRATCNRECSVQEAVHHILPELKIRRILPAVYLLNTNLPVERV